MKAYAMALDLKESPDVVEEYTRHHRAVWPEVLAGLRDLGISRMKIFLHGRRLFMYIEAPDDFDLSRDFPKYMETERGKQWDELMRDFQVRVPGATPDEWWAPMEEVFDLFGPQGES